MLTYTSDFQGYACKFSPFNQEIMAWASSQYYGIIGNGKLEILNISASYNSAWNNTSIQKPMKTYSTNEGIFDITFSEVNPSHIISSGADGTIKLWDFSSPKTQPLLSIKQHPSEIWSVAWSHLQTNWVASAGSDQTVKITDISNGKILSTIPYHCNVVYSCTWHPTLDSIISSTSADGTCRWIDIKSNKEVKVFNSNCEVMFSDFNKYESTLALAHSNGLITMHDWRGSSNHPMWAWTGHKWTARKWQFSPFNKGLWFSVGYDMNVNIWNTSNSIPWKVLKHHTEFVYGLDCSLFKKELICTTSWDNTCALFNYQ